MERAQGIDIAQVNGIFSFDNAKKNGAIIQFIVLRASLADRRDTQFHNSLKESASVPIRGAYHYFTYSTHWEIQANRFLKEVEGKELHFYALDFEKRGNAPKKEADYISKNADGARQWLERVSKSSGKPTLFYTNPSTYNELTRLGHRWMGDWPLWLANYASKPNLPDGVTDWRFWQHSADGNNMGKKYGVDSADVDLDYYNGTVEELHQWLMPQTVAKPRDLVKVVTPQLTWRDVINATKQVDSLRYGAWLKNAGVLDAIKQNRLLLDQPYSGSPIEEWQIGSNNRLEIYKLLNMDRHDDARPLTSTWRDVINATKQVDSLRYGAWLKNAGVLEAIKQDRSLLNQPYSGVPIIEWQIDPEKRLAILERLKTLVVEVAAPTESRTNGLIKLDVPFISQWDKQEANLHDADCGPTCLAMILRAEGIKGSPRAKTISVNQLYQRYLPDVLASKNRNKYTTLGQLKIIGLQEGLDARFNQYKGQNEALTGLRNWISAGKPFIALINYAEWNPTVQLGFNGKHFVVVTGFDEAHVYVHDPLFPVSRKDEGAFYKWTNEKFMAGWSRVDLPNKFPNQNFVYFYTNKVVARH